MVDLRMGVYAHLAPGRSLMKVASTVALIAGRDKAGLGITCKHRTLNFVKRRYRLGCSPERLWVLCQRSQFSR
jgi:hypothetical protein